MELTITQEYVYPSLVRRFASTLIDVFFLLSIPLIISSLGFDLAFIPKYGKVIIFILFYIYEPICNALGCTLGQYLLKIRVRKMHKLDKRLNIFQALLRHLVKIGLGAVSFFTITGNDERRAIHDELSKSVVIKLL